MAEAEREGRVLRFGNFEADLPAGELRKAGVKLKLSGQPFQILAILLVRPGEVVTRDELQRQLWPDTFVDVDHNLNTAINKIREALGDSAESPRYVETVPRRGYRFVAPVNGGRVPCDPVPAKAHKGNTRLLSRSLSRGFAITGVVIVMVGALSFWRSALRTPGIPKVLRFTKLTNDGQAKFGPMATDGSRVYFTEELPDGRSLVFQVSTKGGEATPLLMSLKQPRVLDLSKDGTELLVSNFEGTPSSPLWLQPVAGGSPRRVGTAVGVDARFGADGSSILYSTESTIYAVSRDGASAHELHAGGYYPFAMQFSPDGRVFRFSQWDPDHARANLTEVTSDGRRGHPMFAGCCGKWTADGRFFVFQDRLKAAPDLWVLPESRSFWWWRRDQKATQLTAGPLDFESPLPSKDGGQIFTIGSLRRSEIVRYDLRSGEFIPYLPGLSAEGLAFSPDGQWVVYTSFPEGLLWRSRVDGSDRLQLTFPPMQAALPRWSPDGKQIAFNAKFPPAPWNIYIIPSEGGTPTRVLPSAQNQMDANWSPDGNSLAFASAPWDLNTPIYTIDLRSTRVSALPGSDGLFSPHWSPDGRFMAALTEESPQRLRIFEFATRKWTDASGFDTDYETWSRDGKYIYFESTPVVNASRQIVRFRLSDRKTEHIADLKNVGRILSGTFSNWFGLAPDDSPLLARDISTQEIYALEMDWP